MANSMILDVRGVSRYFGSLAAVNNLSFQVSTGEIFGIAGPNGSGKTTLVNTITHIIAPNGGEIYFKGEGIHNKRSYQICHLGIARTFQNPEIFGSMSVLDNLRLSETYGRKKDDSRDKHGRLKQLVQFVGLGDKTRVRAEGLIISEKKRLMLANALATSPELLFLDEPCAGLTAIESKEMISLIKQINEQGITIILIEHNMKVLMNISDRVMIMNHGISLCEGSPDHVCADESVIETYLGRKYGRKEND